MLHPPMPTPSIAPALHATAHAEAGASSFARKARFWDRIAPKYAAEPIADQPSVAAGAGQQPQRGRSLIVIVGVGIGS